MDLIKPFLIGGVTIAGGKLLSKKVDPAYAPLLSAVPTGIIASFFIKDEKAKREYYTGYLIVDIFLSLTIDSILLGTLHFVNTPVDYLSIIGYLFWITASFLGIKFSLWFSRKK